MAGKDELARTPEPPYWAVIFASTRKSGEMGYAAAAARMLELAAEQPGFLGVDSAREGVGITVSYWSSREAIAAWKRQVEHVEVQRRGRADWYRDFSLRVARVEEQRFFSAPG